MARRDRIMGRRAWIFAAIFLLGLITAPAMAVTLHAALAVTDFGSPSVFGFSFGSPYAGGPYDAMAANVGGTLGDFSGDGASLTGSLVGKVDGITVITIPLSTTIAAGSVGAIDSVPTGAGPAGSASSGISTGVGGMLTQNLSFTLSGGGDLASLILVGVLSGGQTPFAMMNSIAVNDLGSPSSFGFGFSQPFEGQYDFLSVGFMGALMDGTIDGAALTNLHIETLIDGTEVAAVDLTGNYATSPGQLSISGFPSGTAFGPAQVASYAAPASGLMSLDLNFTLSGGGDNASLVAGMELFNAQVVPEPATLSLLGIALLGVAARRRTGKAR